MSKSNSMWTAVAVLALGMVSSANAAWTFGSGSTVAADGTGVSITGVSGAYAANGGTLASGATGTAIVAAGASCPDTQCGVGSANTYGISGFAGSAWVAGNTAAQLQMYSGGKGMASDSSGGSVPNHALDNGPATNGSDLISGLGNTEAVLLSFSSSVVLSSIGIGWKSGDADISLFRFTGSVAPSMNGIGTSLANMATAGWQLVGNYGDLITDTSDPYNTVNSGNKGSSWWLISAYNSTYGSATSGSVDQGNDFFKLYAVAGTKCQAGNDCGPSNTPGIPEPGSLALVAVAIAGAAGSLRRRKPMA